MTRRVYDVIYYSDDHPNGIITYMVYEFYGAMTHYRLPEVTRTELMAADDLEEAAYWACNTIRNALPYPYPTDYEIYNLHVLDRETGELIVQTDYA